MYDLLIFIMTGCCGCCAALRPRYKRLVDNIFPVNPEVANTNCLIGLVQGLLFCGYNFQLLIRMDWSEATWTS